MTKPNNPPVPTLKRVVELIEKVERTSTRALWSSTRDRSWLISDQLAMRLAKLNGWTRTRSDFSIEALARGGPARFDHSARPWWQDHHLFDHVRYFRRGRQAAAILTQPYSVIEEGLGDWLASHRLRMWTPPNPWASFHYPGNTLCLVLTSLAVDEVRWLPEQLAFDVRMSALAAADADRVELWRAQEAAVVAASTANAAGIAAAP